MHKILFVDDEKVLRLTLNKNLSKSGYDVTTAATGEEAILYLHDQFYDIIIADHYLDSINGFELITKAKKLYPQIKSILISGAYSRTTNELFDKIVDAFLPKPIGLHDMLESIETVLNS